MEAPDALALEGPELALTPGDDISTLLFACSAEVFGSIEALTLDEPEAEALKVAGGELVEGEDVGCGSDGWFGLRHLQPFHYLFSSPRANSPRAKTFQWYVRAACLAATLPLHLGQSQHIARCR